MQKVNVFRPSFVVNFALRCASYKVKKTWKHTPNEHTITLTHKSTTAHSAMHCSPGVVCHQRVFFRAIVKQKSRRSLRFRHFRFAFPLFAHFHSAQSRRWAKEMSTPTTRPRRTSGTKRIKYNPIAAIAGKSAMACTSSQMSHRWNKKKRQKYCFFPIFEIVFIRQ